MADLLLCTETGNLCFDDDFDQPIDHKNAGLVNAAVRSESDPPLVGLALLTNDCELSFSLMIDREKEHSPRDDYLSRLRGGDLDLSFRGEALEWILKAHSHYGYGALSVCLSVNYLDRFLSVYELPRGKAWTIQLLAVACFSVAAKVVEISVPLTVDLQVGDPRYVFEGKTIKRMELLVMNSLKWRMQACTPISFIEFFLGKLNNDQLPSEPLISRSIQLILSTSKAIDFLEFKPSEVAAAVAMHVSGEKQALDMDKAMPCFTKVDKGRVTKCIELIQDLSLNSGPTSTISSTVTALVPQSPNGVLEAAACLSFKSEERTVGSCPNSSHSTSINPENNRRKY